MFRTNFIKLKFWKFLSNLSTFQRFNLGNTNLLRNPKVNPKNGVQQLKQSKKRNTSSSNKNADIRHKPKNVQAAVKPVGQTEITKVTTFIEPTMQTLLPCNEK